MEPYRFSKSIYSPVHERMLELLLAARKRAGLTQVEAAGLLGCRQTFLSKIERGERRLDVVEFIVICHAYQADPARLIRELAGHQAIPRRQRRRVS